MHFDDEIASLKAVLRLFEQHSIPLPGWFGEAREAFLRVCDARLGEFRGGHLPVQAQRDVELAAHMLTERLEAHLRRKRQGMLYASHVREAAQLVGAAESQPRWSAR